MKKIKAVTEYFQDILLYLSSVCVLRHPNRAEGFLSGLFIEQVTMNIRFSAYGYFYFYFPKG